MGRAAQGWTLRQPGGPGTTIYVRFRHKGQRHEYTTGATNHREAQRHAASKYAEVVSGRRQARAVTASFKDLVLGWYESYKRDHAPKTAEMVLMYAEAHWFPFFGDTEHITRAGAQDYARERLTAATRPTVRKELSALRQFVAWAELDVEIPGLPKHGHPGKRAKNARKPKATIVSPEMVAKILAKLPEVGARRLGDNSPPPLIRNFFTVYWETSLRPSTLFALTAPTHYKKGAAELLVTRDIDKAHDERVLDLSPAARKALDDAVTKKGGRIFPPFSLREPLARACTEAKVPVISPYDLRHSRLTAWANMPGVPLAGVSYLAGHKSLATTARYVQAQRDAARAVVLGTGGEYGGDQAAKAKKKTGTR
jgi:integrase